MLFSIQRGFTGRESIAITTSAHLLGSEFRIEAEPSSSSRIPLGSVEYCEKIFGPHRVDFFPDFLKGHLHRHIEKREGTFVTEKPEFIKDATCWKSDHVSQVMPEGIIIPSGCWWVSDPVEFVQEWRYYIANEKLITTGWYAGNDEDEPAPPLDIRWPFAFSAAVDFGRLPDGNLALVECHAPFACGWYGDNHIDYAKWQIEAWTHRYWWLTK